MSGAQTFSFLVARSGEGCSYLEVSEETADKYRRLWAVIVHITQMLK